MRQLNRQPTTQRHGKTATAPRYGRLRLPLLVLLSLTLALAAACTDDETPDEQAAQSAQSADDGTTTVVIVGDLAEGEAATPLADAAAVFATVSPAVAVVQTASGAATGIVIEGGFVVTNAQAVWPYRVASVRLAGGRNFPDVPVAGIDRLLDIAVLGPLPGVTTALAVAQRALPAIGSQAFLIGFANADPGVLQPSISAGLISGQRRWEPGAVTFLQSDVPVAAGQLGGALVTDAGILIGLAGPAFGDDRISNFVSIPDLSDRIIALARGQGATPPGATPSMDAASTDHVVNFFRGDAEQLYLVGANPGDALTATLQGNQDGSISIRDAEGVLLLSRDETTSGLEVLDVTLSGPAPYILVIGNASGIETTYGLVSTVPLAPFADAEDGQVLDPGDTVVGAIDAPGDSDVFRIELAAGQSVSVAASSLTIDTVITVEGPGGVLVDDASGGGPLGSDAALVLQSETGGIFLVRIGDARVGRGGPYAVSVTALSGRRPPGLTTDGEATGSLAGPPVVLPAGRGLAVRGDVVDGALVPRLATIAAQPGETGASQIVVDADGQFRVIARVVAIEAAQATVRVLNEDGDTVADGITLGVVCTSGTNCIGSTSFDVTDDEDAGPWSVELLLVDGEISGWQLEVLSSPNPTASATATQRQAR